MPQDPAPPRFYRFGPYELDSTRRLLLSNGRRVSVTPKALEVLLALVERHGSVVTKDELMRLVWPDTAVEDISLTRNISVLRKILGEKRDEHNYIVTVPGTGYCFVAPVEAVAVDGPPAVISTRPWLWAGVAVLTITVFATWNARPVSAPPIWQGVPLTSYPGIERDPSLSPDGSRVAFVWNGDKQDNPDIYVKPVGPAPPLRITTNSAEDLGPTWSPDGRSLAFLRRLGGDRNQMLVVPAEGGPERILGETLSAMRTDSRMLAWSPDGRWLAVCHREPEDPVDALFLISSAGGGKRRLTLPPRGFSGDDSPAFAPDGRSLAFRRLTGYRVGELHVLPLASDLSAAGEPRQLTRESGSIESPVWTPDSRRVLYVFRQSDSVRELRVIVASGSRLTQRVPLLDRDVFQPTLGRQLIYARANHDNNIWRAQIPPPGVPLREPQRLIASTRNDDMPRYSPDGRKIAFGSNRSGKREIWVADADGSNLVQLTSLGGPQIGPAAWSPDGRHLVFHARPNSQADLFTIAASGGEPKQLTDHPSDDLVPTYSHDGRWIYFNSLRSGRRAIWRMPAAGGAASQIVHSEGGAVPEESPDRKTLYFCHELPEKGIWKLPLPDGEAVQVLDRYRPSHCGLAVTAEGLYYTAMGDAHHHYSIDFMSFATGKRRPVVVSDRSMGSLGISVSPEQQFLIYGQTDQVGSDLMLVENFIPR